MKIAVTDEKSGDREWMWLLVGSSDDKQQLVSGQLDLEPIVATSPKEPEVQIGASSAGHFHPKCCVILPRP